MSIDTSPYPGEEARERELEELCARAGGALCHLGDSVQGRPIRAVRVPSSSTASARVLVNANIHGPEWIASRVAMEVLRRLGDERGAVLRASAEVVVVPCVNVDGYARTEHQRGVGTLKELRGNAHGVDLNRNFPIPPVERRGFSGWFGETISQRFAGSGSGDPRRATYRGTAPLCEPEARALDAFAEAEGFVACASLHSFMGTCIPPYVTTASDARHYAHLARAFAMGQRHRPYFRLANRFVDVFTGELEDRLHHDRGCWAMTIECFSLWESLRQHLWAPSLFWRFNPHDPTPVVDRDADGVMAYLLAALSLPRRGERVRPAAAPSLAGAS